MKKNEIVKELLKRQKEFDDFIERLSAVDVQINFEIDLLELALDIMGVPADNTAEKPESFAIASNTNVWPEDLYCRDWAINSWFEQDQDVDNFISYVEKMKRRK